MAKYELATILGDFGEDEDRQGERLTLCWADDPETYAEMVLDQGAIWAESEYGVFEDALGETADTLLEACETVEALYGHSEAWDLYWEIDPRDLAVESASHMDKVFDGAGHYYAIPRSVTGTGSGKRQSPWSRTARTCTRSGSRRWKMTESEFKRSIQACATMRHTTNKPLAFDFLLGYQRGLRRAYHGESFGTAEEHALWLSLGDEQLDRGRQARGRGYRAGLAGTPIEETEIWGK